MRSVIGGAKMTLQEINERLFPCIYKTRNGELVEITGFAFIGNFLNDDETKRGDMVFTWDAEGNYFHPSIRYQKSDRNADLMTLVKSPQKADIIVKKNLPAS